MGNSFCRKPALDEDEQNAPELGEDASKTSKAKDSVSDGGANAAKDSEKSEPVKESEASAADGDSSSTTLGPYKGNVISHIIGHHGAGIKKIQEDSGCEVNINDDGTVSVSGSDTTKAIEIIKKIVEEAEHPDYVGSEGKRLRDEAQAMYKDADETYKLSQEAFDSGDKSKGHELLDKTKQTRAGAKAKDKEAARAIWAHRNSESELKLDFHGLHVDEAMELFEEALEALQKKEKSDRVLEVIPGAGHHSKGGESHAKLKPATVSMLKKKNLEFVDHNVGSFYVNLDKMSMADFEAKCQELNNAD